MHLVTAARVQQLPGSHLACSEARKTVTSATSLLAHPPQRNCGYYLGFQLSKP